MQVEEVLGPYERSALYEVQQWVNREPGWTDRMLGGESSLIRQALEVLLETGPGRKTLKTATDGALAALERKVLRNLEGSSGVPVPTDPKGREAALRVADERAGELRDGYVKALGAQGALAGAASLSAAASAVALVADVAIAVGAALRAAAHHAALYGAAPSHRSALEAAVEFVAVASETDPTVRKRTIAAVGQHLAENPPFSDLTGELPRVILQQLSSRGLKDVVEQMVRRVLRGRFAGVVPILGGAAGGAASAWLASHVCEASRQLGRMAFLMRHTPLQLTDILVLEAPISPSAT